jgi:cephalosporin hydroxylase
MSELPPRVDVDLSAPALRDYWQARAQQHTFDTYAGLRLCKFPEDLRVYEHLLWLAAPDTVVELGVFAGGSTLWFRDRLQALAGYGRLTRPPRVIGVDSDLAAARDAISRSINSSGVVLIEGALEDPTTAARVAAQAGDRCMVVEDSAHTFETTTAALHGYARLVPPGGFMVVEDAAVDDDALRLDEWPRGVRPAIDAWLRTSEGRDFTVRRDLELYGVTSNPGGILQRQGTAP